MLLNWKFTLQQQNYDFYWGISHYFSALSLPCFLEQISCLSDIKLIFKMKYWCRSVSGCLIVLLCLRETWYLMKIPIIHFVSLNNCFHLVCCMEHLGFIQQLLLFRYIHGGKQTWSPYLHPNPRKYEVSKTK